MNHASRFLAIAVTVCVTAGFLALTAPASAQTTDAARLEELQRIIQQQQAQIEAQSRMLTALQQQVNELARSAAQASATASQASQAATQAAVAAQQASEQVTQAQEPEKLVKSGKKGVKLVVSGQVNRGVLISDDGHNTDVFHVDNDNSSTRVRFVGTGVFNEEFKVGTQVEVQFESNSTAKVNQLMDRGVGPNNFTERKLEFYADSKTLGRVWVGQGDTASNGTSEVDLSGTGVIGYSAVNDLAGGLILSRNGAKPVAGDLTIGGAFSNLDGLSRDDRIRYDTPTFRGAKLSASAIAGERWDVAGRYAGEVAGIKVAGAAAYWERPDKDGVNGSVSALHKKSGLNLTFAAGNADSDTPGREDATFYYVKLGLLRTYIEQLGKTAVAVDYFHSNDHSRNADEARSFGAFIVQNVSKIATEFYLGGRLYDVHRAGARFQDLIAVLGGARIKF